MDREQNDMPLTGGTESRPAETDPAVHTADTEPVASPAVSEQPKASAPTPDPVPTPTPPPIPTPTVPFTAQPTPTASPVIPPSVGEVPSRTVYIAPPSTPVYAIPTAEKESEEKKSKSGPKLGAFILVAVICVLLSGAAAFGGTFAARQLLESQDAAAPTQNGASSQNAAPPQAGNVQQPAKTTVIYESVASSNETVSGYSSVATGVLPTVVEITTETKTSTSFFFGDYVTQGAGSGVIISSDGYIVTNNHVVEGAENITVTLQDGTTYTAKLIGTDSDTDIAVIKIEATDLTVAVWSTAEMKVGEEVLAVGNPLGRYGGTVTNGIISALSRDITIEGTEMTLIQTNAAVNPGNSGGGLFNLSGELIGIVNAKTTTSSSGTSVEGIGFAIPGAQAKKVAEDLIQYGYVKGKIVLGIEYVEVTSSYDAYRYGVNALGVYVTASQNNALRAYDRIIAIDEIDVSTASDIKAALRGHAAGDVVKVTVVRNGKLTTADVTLTEYVPQ